VFAARYGAETLSSSAERKADLARRWESVKLSIGRVQDLQMSAFRRSRRYWQKGEFGVGPPFGPKVVSKMPPLFDSQGIQFPADLGRPPSDG
jgi:hypothetical protein